MWRVRGPVPAVSTPRDGAAELPGALAVRRSVAGVYGAAYAAAAHDILRRWPVVVAGLLGRILGPIRFAVAVSGGVFPVAFGLVILLNDLIRVVPLSLTLLQAHRSNRAPKGATA